MLSDAEDYLLKIQNGVLLYYEGEQDEHADITIRAKRLGILAIANRNADAMSRTIDAVEGNAALYDALCKSMTQFSLYFNIVEP